MNKEEREVFDLEEGVSVTAGYLDDRAFYRKVEAQRAYQKWWRELTKQGDPARRPNLSQYAWQAALAFAAKQHESEIAELARIQKRLRTYSEKNKDVKCLGGGIAYVEDLEKILSGKLLEGESEDGQP